jgi:hypothetical protein
VTPLPLRHLSGAVNNDLLSIFREENNVMTVNWYRENLVLVVFQINENNM